MSVGTITKVKSEGKIKIKKPKDYKVIMYNDDYTTMEFVIHVLMSIFNKNIVEAEKIMLDVHEKGIGVAGIYSYDIAVTKATTAMSSQRNKIFLSNLQLRRYSYEGYK
mgnify:CR=1 FL=1